MRDYAYIGVANALFETDVKFLVRSPEHSLSEGDIVAFKYAEKTIYAKVTRVAYVRVGGKEEALLAEFRKAIDVDKIYDLAWEKEEEVTEDGN